MVEQERVAADWSGNCVYLPVGDRGAAVNIATCTWNFDRVIVENMGEEQA
jgi:hypothetical protein